VLRRLKNGVASRRRSRLSLRRLSSRIVIMVRGTVSHAPGRRQYRAGGDREARRRGIDVTWG